MNINKNVLITGASGNLGQAVVEKYVAADYRVIATASPGKAAALRENKNITVVEVDLTREADVALTVQNIVQQFSLVDIALLLVGAYASGGIEQADSDSLRNQYTLNFETAYHVVRPVFLQMLKQPLGGRIVLVGSRPSLQAEEGKNSLAYALSKSLLFKLADYLNAEGSSQNVVTTVAVPSVIDTPANRKANPAANFSDWVSPEEIAGILFYITSEQGRALREPIVKIYGNT
jgi:NAD(P)-dependent dehydrogenase (short-subunit alcohol dehydrogenase family)